MYGLERPEVKQQARDAPPNPHLHPQASHVASKGKKLASSHLCPHLVCGLKFLGRGREYLEFLTCLCKLLVFPHPELNQSCFLEAVWEGEEGI